MSIIDDSVVELERRKEALKMFEMKRMDCEREGETEVTDTATMGQSQQQISENRDHVSNQ